ncbi:hypothetical protein GTY44_15015 [Streptomyces sp. SID5914]|nr:hypothetical protein [Streptomyces sp. SID5914]MZG14784.1 hypothetical protein [Streptomyces sp. SID5914]
MAGHTYPLSESQAETLRTLRWAQLGVAVLMLVWFGLALWRGEYGPSGFNLWFPGACAVIWPALAAQSFSRLKRHQEAIRAEGGSAL